MFNEPWDREREVRRGEGGREGRGQYRREEDISSSWKRNKKARDVESTEGEQEQ